MRGRCGIARGEVEPGKSWRKFGHCRLRSVDFLYAHALVNQRLATRIASHFRPTEERRWDWQTCLNLLGKRQWEIGSEAVTCQHEEIGSRRVDSAIISPLCHNRLDMTDITPRVNGARLNDYVGQSVRLICKVTKVRVFPHPRRASTSFIPVAN